jgi:hypothetical protein
MQNNLSTNGERTSEVFALKTREFMDIVPEEEGEDVKEKDLTNVNKTHDLSNDLNNTKDEVFKQGDF